MGFQSVDFGVNISVGEDGPHFGECIFRQSYFYLYSVSHLASGVIVKPNYLKVSTCLFLSHTIILLIKNYNVHDGPPFYDLTLNLNLRKKKAQEGEKN